VHDTVTTGIKDISLDPEFRIYPNPVTSSFHIKINNEKASRNYLLRISDSFGRVLSETKNFKSHNEISTQNLSPGLYLVSLINEDRISTQRIIVIN